MKQRSTDIRRQCATHKEREPCFICGEHRAITEAHHVLPLKDVAALLESCGILDEPSVVWLCPNCHTYVHELKRGRLPHNSLRKKQLKRAFSIDELANKYLQEQFGKRGL